jgi:hypothetical protein
MSQFWLSNASTPENATKLAYTTRNKIDNFVFFAGNPKAVSERIFLEYKKRYYFEILKVLNAAVDGRNPLTTELDWMLPDTNYFTKIDGRYVSHYFNTTSSLYNNSSWEINSDNPSASLRMSDEEDEAIAPNFPSNKTAERQSKLEMKKMTKTFGEQFENIAQYNRQNVGKLPYLKRKYTVMAFPKCTYEPSYMKRTHYSRYDGVWNVRYPEVYPNEGSGSTRWANVKKAFDKDDRFDGSILIRKKEAEAVVLAFMNGLNKKFSG